jgi:Leucine Rich repeat
VTHPMMANTFGEPIARRQHSYPRFSLRGLIIVVLLIGGWLGWVVSSARRQRLTVLAIEKSGGGVRYHWQFKNGRYLLGRTSWTPKWLVDHLGIDYFSDVTWVLVGPRGISDSELRQVGQFSQLEQLQVVRGSEMTDAGLTNLEGLGKLRRVFLSGPGFTDVGLAHLEHLTRLRALGLSGCNITDEGLIHLGRLTNLEGLGLTDCKVTDAALVHLKGLTKLKALGLTNCPVTNAGLVNLEGLTNLQDIKLNGTNISDRGLVHLRNLTGLRFLSLVNTRVTDAGLKNLERHSRLAMVWLQGSQVTDAGEKEFQKALPKVKIER